MVTKNREAKIIKDAYFTNYETAKWCLEQLDDINGKVILEPSCGSGVFVKANPQLNWVTNELYPQFANGFKADYNIDFVDDKQRSILPEVDVVIGNPPFGYSSSLAKKFVRISLEIAETVAMILPRGCRRGSFIDKLPEDVKVIFDLDIPNSNFLLPDGREKKVGCCYMGFQHQPGFVRPKILDYKPIGYKGERGGNKWPEWATHGIGAIYGAGVVFNRSQREIGFLENYWVRLTPEQSEKVYDVDFTYIIERTQTSFPRITKYEIITELNKLFVS